MKRTQANRAGFVQDSLDEGNYMIFKFSKYDIMNSLLLEFFLGKNHKNSTPLFIFNSTTKTTMHHIYQNGS